MSLASLLNGFRFMSFGDLPVFEVLLDPGKYFDLQNISMVLLVNFYRLIHLNERCLVTEIIIDFKFWHFGF